MIYTIATEHKVVPKWNDNNKAKDGERFEVVINHPSAAEISKLYSAEKESSGEFEFCLYIKSLPGLKVEVDGEVQDATPSIVYNAPGMVDLVVELKQEYEKLIINKKK